MSSTNRIPALTRYLAIASATSAATLWGCSLDTSGLGLVDSSPGSDAADVLVVDAAPPPDSSKPDSGPVDASDADVLDASDADVLDASDADVLDASDADVLDASDADVLDAADADVLDAADADVLDAADADVLDAADASDATVEDVSQDAPLGDVVAADVADSDVAEAPEAAAPAIESTFVAADSMAVDRVRTGDGPIVADGAMDGAFIVSLYGEIVGLALISTDAVGKPAGGQQWDTYVGAATIPTGVGAGYTVGSSTWQLGVWEGALARNASDGSLVPLPLGTHTLRLYGASSGYFVTGRTFRVVAELAGGGVILGPVVTY